MKEQNVHHRAADALVMEWVEKENGNLGDLVDTIAQALAEVEKGHLDIAFSFEPKLTREKMHRLLGHLTKWSVEEIDVHLMSFSARNDRIDP